MSTLTVTNIQATGETASRAVSGVAAAWAKYGMDDNTINDSVNLSSITDNSTGNFTNTWTNAFGNANYSHLANGSVGSGGSSINKADFYTPSTSSVRLLMAYHNGTGETGPGTAYDYELVSLLIHGDLA